MGSWIWSRLTLAVALVGALVVGGWLSYVGLAQLLLGTGLLEAMINRHPEELRVTATNPRSFWPGRLSADEIEIRFQDRSIQAEFVFDHPRFVVELSELASRRLHVLWLETDGFELRLRMKRDDSPLARRLARQVPPIRGYAEFPARRDEPPSERPFTVELENVRGRVRELWIEQIRWRGDAEVAGGFRLEPKRRLRIAPSELSVASGALSIGAEGRLGMLRQSRASVKLADTRLERGEVAIAEALEAATEITLSLESPDPLVALIAPGWDAAGGGLVEARGAVERGRVTAGSSLAISVPELAIGRGELDMASAVLAGAHALPGGRVELAVFATELRVMHAGTLLAQAGELAALLSDSSRLAELDAPALEQAHVQGLSVPRLDRVAALAGGPTPIERGELEADVSVSARGSLEERRALGRAAGTLRNVTFRAGEELTIAASGRFTVDAEGSEPGRPFSGRGDLELSSLSLFGNGTRASGSATARGARLRGGRRIELIEAPFTASFDDGEHLLRVLGVTSRPVPRAAADVLDLDRVRLRGSVHHTPDATTLVLRDGRSGPLSVAGCMRGGRTRRGAFLIRSPVGSVGLALDGGRTQVELLAQESWLARALAPLPRCNDLVE